MEKKYYWLKGDYRRIAEMEQEFAIDCYEDYTAKLDYGTGEYYTSAEIAMLRRIEENPGASVTQLAEMTGRTKSAVSQLVKRLLNTGIVQKAYDADNAKVGKLFLTEKGRSLVISSIEKSRMLIEEQIDFFRERFTDEEIEAFFDLLQASIQLREKQLSEEDIKK
ncbi:MAG: MarR family winged helix-turn-helix transcriptional regulator [Emergencia sp.]